MVIFGTRGVTSTADSGKFDCPACGAGRHYRHRKVRRFFTLYFIPVIPLELLGEYVECDSCRGTFKPEVLQWDPQVEQTRLTAEFHRAVKSVMVRMVVADGHVAGEELQTVQDVYAQLTGSTLSEAEMMEEVETARRDGRGVLELLPQLAPGLNDRGKELVLQAALLVAAADGELQEEERELLGAIGAALDMTASHVRGVFQSTLATN